MSPDTIVGSAGRERPSAPRVTVVLPTHNRPQLLAEALDSLERQTYADWEVVVVDDASSPPVDFKWLAGQHTKLRVVSHAGPRGGAAGKNSGIALGRGQLFAFLDDDDLYDARYLERAVGCLDGHPEIEVLFMGVGWFGNAAQHGERTHGASMARTLAEANPIELEPGLLLFGEQLLSALLRRVPMPFQRPVVRRSALDRIGHYRPDCLLWDCEWALRASAVSQCALLDEPLYRQRVDGQGTSSRGDRKRDHLESALEMTLRLYRKPPFPVSSTTRALLRKAASRNAAALAHYLSRSGDLAGCLRAWWTSEKLQPSASRLKLPLAAGARAMGLMRDA